MKNRKRNIFWMALFTLVALSAKAESADEKVKEWIDDAADSLKKAVDLFGDNVEALQDHLDHYAWKGLIQDEASSGAATLKGLCFNGHPKGVVARPGEVIKATLLCRLDRDQCAPFSLYRIVIGIKGQGGQATVGNEFGFGAHEKDATFFLVAPPQPGIYQVRFRVVESLLVEHALKGWLDAAGNEPDASTTIGVICVY